MVSAGGVSYSIGRKKNVVVRLFPICVALRAQSGVGEADRLDPVLLYWAKLPDDILHLLAEMHQNLPFVQYSACSRKTPNDMHQLQRLWKLLSDDEKKQRVEFYHACDGEMSLPAHGGGPRQARPSELISSRADFFQFKYFHLE